MQRLALEVRAHRLRSRLPKSIQEVVRGLSRSDTVVDVGAHVGVASLMFARQGCRVFSIEPNEHAYVELEKLFKRNQRVKTIHAAAVVGAAREVPLFLHRDSERHPIRFAQGSSLLSAKPNVGDATQMVPALDLAKFLAGFGRLSVMKVDIEGYEVELLPWLASRGALDAVDHVFVETHGAKWPGLTGPTARMKESCESRLGPGRVHWNWP